MQFLCVARGPERDPVSHAEKVPCRSEPSLMIGQLDLRPMWEFPQIRDTLLVGPPNKG